MEQEFEVTIEKRNGWYIGWADAVPGAFSQAKTIKEVQEDLKEAIQLILESQRDLKRAGRPSRVLKRRVLVKV
jgi:predicted RNase H-like HicB family nuclease